MTDLSKLKRGTEHMTSSRRGGYIPTIYWKLKDENHYLAFITPLGEIPKLLTHFIRTANGWRFFICRKNDIFEDESQGECVICEMKALGKNAAPTYRHLAMAVELEAQEERVKGRREVSGFTVMMDEWENKDGEKQNTPHVGVISESAKNFWTPFSAHVIRLIDRGRPGELEDVVYEVIRNGVKDQTSYSFYEYEMRPDLSDFEFPTLEDFIEDKGSLAHYEESLSGGVETDEDEADDKPSTREKGDQSDATSKFDELRAKLEDREKDEAEPAESTA